MHRLLCCTKVNFYSYGVYLKSHYSRLVTGPFQPCSLLSNGPPNQIYLEKGVPLVNSEYFSKMVPRQVYNSSTRRFTTRLMTPPQSCVWAKSGTHSYLHIIDNFGTLRRWGCHLHCRIITKLGYGTCASLCKERVDSFNSNPESKYLATKWITYSSESLKGRGIQVRCSTCVMRGQYTSTLYYALCRAMRRRMDSRKH